MNPARAIAARRLAIFGAIALLVLGGLGWATRESLRLESERAEAAAEAERQDKFRQAQQAWNDRTRLALWRLDARLAPTLAREESRPYTHYAALHSPFPALDGKGAAVDPGKIFLPTPLLTADLPEWIQLHFQIDPAGGWHSPQVIPDELQKTLRKQPVELAIQNVTGERSDLLNQLQKRFPIKTFLPQLQAKCSWIEEPGKLAGNQTFNYYGNAASNLIAGNSLQTQATQQSQAGLNGKEQMGFQNPGQNDFSQRVVTSRAGNFEGRGGFAPDNRGYLGYQINGPVLTRQPVEVNIGAMTPVWLPSAEQSEFLLMIRAGEAGKVPVFQGFAVDWPKLQAMLKLEVSDLFDDVSFKPLPEGEPTNPERTMSQLPVEMTIGDPAPMLPDAVVDKPLWSPLHIGLGFAWLAALVALAAIGVGGWSLVSLSERRMRFVSAVTHELRTPMTTLRLYVDMLESGMVTDPKQQEEYLRTMQGETDRLNRLISNVLDYARLEKQKGSARKEPVVVAELLSSLEAAWRDRLKGDGKELTVEDLTTAGTTLTTDRGLLEQIVCNLLDNARKYAKEAVDCRVELRAFPESGKVVFEVRDHGPGVPSAEKCAIFRPFRRGGQADVQAGGVGLGLALADGWAKMLGGKLSYRDAQPGAAFRIELPV